MFTIIIDSLWRTVWKHTNPREKNVKIIDIILWRNVEILFCIHVVYNQQPINI